MNTQGVVIWAGDISLIVWCADGGALAYVADRRRAGDPNRALTVGDMVDLTVHRAGAMRVGSGLRYRGTGAAGAIGAVRRQGAALAGPVFSARAGLTRVVAQGAAARAAAAEQAAVANPPHESGAA